MMIGKRGAATTAISAARPDHVTVRGRDLTAKDEAAIPRTADESDVAR
jgi:hypothetical protein